MLGAVILAGGHGRRMGGADKASLLSTARALSTACSPSYPTAPHRGCLSASPRRAPGVRVTAVAPSPASRPAPRRYPTAPSSPSSLWMPRFAATASPSALDPRLLHSRCRTHPRRRRLPPAAVFPLARSRAQAQLDSLPTARNVSVRRLIHGANFIEIPGTGAERDYDTRAELRELPAFTPHTALRAHRQPLTYPT